MKKTLQARLAKKEARKAELQRRNESATTMEELRSIGIEAETINDEIMELRSMIDAMPDDVEPIAGGSHLPTEQRSAQTGGTPGHAQILAAFGLGGAPQSRSDEPEDKYGTLEYRRAFMAFALTGEVKPELRSNEMTTTTEAAAVIPTTILNEVISQMKVYGQVFSRVRKLNIKGGVAVPILSLKPTATWITQATPSDKKKITANTSVTFTYFGLECKVAMSLLADTVTLAGFETVIIDLIVEAMVKASDLAVVAGVGTTQPLGITVDPRVPAGQIVTLSSAEFTSWDGWKKKVFAKMPLAYKAGATILTAAGTYDGYIDGMVDANGQPIARTNYGITDGPQDRFGGKEVIQVEDDIIATYDDAAVGDIVAIYVNLKNYGWNSNMQMTMYRYFDHDTNEWIDKAILIADGKLIDPYGVVIVKKGA